MRQDMSRVVTKGHGSYFRPFAGRKVRSHRTGARDPFESQDWGFYPHVVDVEPVEIGRVAMHVRDGSWGRGGNATFAPLRRWLASQVGRKWDEAFAEIQARYVPAMRYSLREWLAGEVGQNCYRNAEGVVCVNTDYRGVQAAAEWFDYYVEPESGVLCASGKRSLRSVTRQRREQEAAERAAVFRQGKGNLQYHKRDGVWYEVTIGNWSELLARILAEEKASDSGYSESKYTPDTFLKKPRIYVWDSQAQELYGDRNLYAVSHRALSRREVQRLNLG